MATVPTPSTQTAGQVVPAATINSQGNLATYLAGRTESGGARRPLCKMRQTVAQSIPNVTDTAINFDAEDVDYDNGHSTVTNTSRYTAGTAGWYQVNFAVTYAANATGHRVAELRVNGATFQPGSIIQLPTSSGTETTAVSGSFLVFLNATDYLELCGHQNSGGALLTIATALTQSFLTVEWRSV